VCEFLLGYGHLLETAKDRAFCPVVSFTRVCKLLERFDHCHELEDFRLQFGNVIGSYSPDFNRAPVLALPELDQHSDTRDREPKGSGAFDKAERMDITVRVDAIPRFGTAGPWNKTNALIISDELRRHTRSDCCFSDVHGELPRLFAIVAKAIVWLLSFSSALYGHQYVGDYGASYRWKVKVPAQYRWNFAGPVM